MLRFALSLLIVTNMANALTVQNKSCQCSPTMEDTNESPVSFDFGSFRGQCVDTCRFRPARLERHEQQGLLKVKNIFHLENFYQTVIDPQNILSMEVGFQEFSPAVHHVVVRYEFKNPIQLIPQIATSETKPVEVKFLLYSAEGVPPKGRKYSMLESLKGDYLIVGRLITNEEFETTSKKKSMPLSFYSVPVEKNRAAQSFEWAVRDADLMGWSQIYGLFTNNCATKALEFVTRPKLNRSFSSFPVYSQVRAALTIPGPLSTFGFLETYGLANMKEKR